MTQAEIEKVNLSAGLQQTTQALDKFKERQQTENSRALDRLKEGQEQTIVQNDTGQSCRQSNDQPSEDGMSKIGRMVETIHFPSQDDYFDHILTIILPGSRAYFDLEAEPGVWEVEQVRAMCVAVIRV